MNDISKLSPQQLRRAADIQERIQALQKQLNDILGSPAGTHAPDGESASETSGKRRFSAATIAKMRRAQKERWAKRKGGAQPEAGEQEQKPTRKFTRAGRAALSAAAKERWRKARAEGRATLKRG